MKHCIFYWVCQGVQVQRLHEAGAAGADAQRRHRQDRVADDDAQAELGLAPLGSQGRDGGDAGRPRLVRAQPLPIDEAEQGVREREPGHVLRDLRAGGPAVASSSSEGVASGAMPT